jgi:transmembrane sensor
MADYPVLPQGDPTEQAIYWLTLLTSGEAGAEQRRGFDNWLAENTAHRAAWDNAQLLWNDVAMLTDADIAEIGFSSSPTAVALRPRRLIFSYPVLGLAACLLLSAAFRLSDMAYYLADYRAGTGIQQHIALADGSTVQLNTDSALSVDYTPTARRLTLHGGEAWFNVAPDPGRPFEVSTDYGTVRALGTAFDVKNIGGRVTVTVYRHAVRVQLADGEKIDSLPEGAMLTFDRTIRSLDSHANLNETGAWRQQQMRFQDKKLHDVVKELNRYRQGRIVIIDPALNDLPLTGSFDTRNPDEALLMIEQSLGLTDYRITDRLVFLSQGRTAD